MHPAASRSAALLKSLRRHRLVFLQMGEAFAPLRSAVIEGLGGQPVVVADVIAKGFVTDKSLVVVTDVETLALDHPNAANVTLGRLRESVMHLLDEGVNCCLISRSPRISFGDVPGSSLLEDAALAQLQLLDEQEWLPTLDRFSARELPAVGLGAVPDLKHLLPVVLRELGRPVLSALDHALFELDPRGSDGIRFLAPREIEALRGAGLIRLTEQHVPELGLGGQLVALRSCLADLLNESTVPAPELAAVVNGLWFIERTMRSALRVAAREKLGEKWRGGVLPEALAIDVLARARLDSNIQAVSVKELRDPLEWLTLGELFGIANSKTFDGLGVDAVLWRRFQEQLVPVRNRLSHMRPLRGADEETVATWLSVVRKHFAH